MDNPAEAAKSVNETLDEATRKYMPAAAKPIEEAPELACNELGDWYRGLADQATAPASKGAMLRRAKAYYERFMGLHKTDDLARAGTTLMLKKVDDALAKLGPAAEDKSDPSSLTLNLGKGVTMKLIRIRPGKFMMGAEKNPHEVTLTKRFYMGVTEVTQAQFEAVMGTNPSGNKGPTNPVDGVSWDDAVLFCRRLSEKTGKTLRLPAEAEWEYACRAGSKTRFSFGDSEGALGDYAWHKGNTGGKTQPVAQKKPNAWGLYDMHGNVAELCADRFGSYPTGPSTDPQGATSGSERLARGGSWDDSEPGYFRCAARIEIVHPELSQDDRLGLRCVMTLP
jgi:formylglycine-generating enzyme required for sulfatase activity